MLPVCPHGHLLCDSSSHMHVPSAIQGPQHLVIGARMDADQSDPSKLETGRDSPQRSPQRRTRGLGSRRHDSDCTRSAPRGAVWRSSHEEAGQGWDGSLVVLHLARSLTEKKDIYQAILTMSHNKTVGYPSRQFQLAM